MKSLIQFVIISMFSFGVAQSLFASETVKGAKKDFAEFKAELAKKLDQAEIKLQELKTKAAQKGGDAKKKTANELDEANQKVKKEFAELKDDGKDGWKNTKNKISEAIDTLNNKIQAALKD